MIRISKQIAAEKGILAAPNPKAGKSLGTFIVEKVVQFYNSDDVSRVMAGKNNFVSVKEDGNRVHKQKRLILCNLKETYQCFKEQYPDIKIGFSKFCELRPKECVLPGTSGTHSVCVCAHHENFKLMLDGINVSRLTANSEPVLTNYKDCLSQIICNPPSSTCYLKKCDACRELKK
ncbi:hypothetical protein ANN_10662 [Periplaneta americana]|uniref:Uncharacterized protein n=1 Tax=Periplaneta americana TaxID=6978 RepID=A0ABQ8T2W1_PERAM|nr:hypothetical protein ANN_10662 [Periplaneta americana]